MARFLAARYVLAGCLVVLIAGCGRKHDPSQLADITAASIIAQHQQALTPESAVKDLDKVATPVATAVVTKVTDSVVGALNVLPIPQPEPDKTKLDIPQGLIDMLIEHEVGSKALYIKKYQRPVCPGGASGVTWGIGYDGGQQTKAAIAADWSYHPGLPKLVLTSGVRGRDKCRPLSATMQDVLTPWQLAEDVFYSTSVIGYYKMTQRAYGKHFDALKPVARGVMLNVSYNRGVSMEGESRREIRYIAKVCIPQEDYKCMAAQLRSMTRLWRGKPDLEGVAKRYDHLADLVEKL